MLSLGDLVSKRSWRPKLENKQCKWDGPHWNVQRISTALWPSGDFSILQFISLQAVGQHVLMFGSVQSVGPRYAICHMGHGLISTRYFMEYEEL